MDPKSMPFDVKRMVYGVQPFSRRIIQQQGRR
jgi:uncharacterized protein YbaA (DUF1428 family)